MATITQRTKKDGSKFFQVQIRLAGYPPVGKSFTTERKAKEWAVLKESAILKNEEINPREASKWTIPEVIDWYTSNPNPHRKLETRKHFQRLNFLKVEFEHLTVKTLTANVLDIWIKKRLIINKPATVYHYYVALKNALVYHSIKHEYSQHIFDRVKCPTTSGERERRFSIEETAKLFKSIKQKSRIKQKEMMLTVLFAINTACRVGEMLKLVWSNVNLDERYVDFIAKDTKTKVFRRIPLTTTAKKILLWVKANHPPSSKNDRVFCFFNPNEHHLSRQFQICCERAEIEEIRWHDLRHEGTSRFFEKTTLTDIEIATITGHKSMDMLKRYAHLRPSTILHKLW